MTTSLDNFFGTYLGIEFRDDSVNMAILKNSLSGFALLSTSSFSLRDDESLVNDIRDYVRQYTITPGNVFVCVPDRWAITKFIDIPLTKGKAALPQLMRFEVERHIPFQFEDIDFDFQVMSQQDTMYSVVFAALQKNKLVYVREFLEKVSLQSRVITMSSFASINSLELRGTIAGGWKDIVGIFSVPEFLGKKGESNVLLFMNGADANLIISRDGSYIYLKSFVIEPGDNVDAISSEFNRQLDDATTLFSISQFSRVFVGGSIAAMPGFEESLKKKTNLPVENVKQLSAIPPESGRVEDIGLDPAVGACYVGLGTGTFRINLLPHKADYAGRRVGSLAAKILIVLVLVLMVAIFATNIFKEKKRLDAMDEVLKKNKPEIAAIDKLTSEIAYTENLNRLLKEIRDSEISLEVLADLTGKLPDEVWITNLNYKGMTLKDNEEEAGELTISGFASSSSPLIPILEDSPYLEKVEFVGPIKKQKDKEQFKIRASLVLKKK
jgi:Tfp pilus assembly PilM family ATPase/Tfp pilus assembly protein PilN